MSGHARAKHEVYGTHRDRRPKPHIQIYREDVWTTQMTWVDRQADLDGGLVGAAATLKDCTANPFSTLCLCLE